MFDVSQMDKVKNYKGKLDVEVIIKFVIGKSVRELKREQAIKNWNKNYSFVDMEEFINCYSGHLKIEIDKISRLLKKSTRSILSFYDLEDKNLSFIDEIKYTDDEKEKVITKLMHRRFPGTRPFKYTTIKELVIDHKRSQYLDIYYYVKYDVIPMLKESRNKKIELK
jgi:hypothetical protein